MHLEHAKLAGLPHHLPPLGRRKLVAALHLQWVRAIRALQRAAIRQLGQKADGRPRAGGRRGLEAFERSELGHGATLTLTPADRRREGSSP